MNKVGFIYAPYIVNLKTVFVNTKNNINESLKKHV